ncbi:hypothetical protein HYQ46_006626 [Verticillium longisporum]|nr:hypothetical protein HYQ46_006626 [Verticillium longisporum]
MCAVSCVLRRSSTSSTSLRSFSEDFVKGIFQISRGRGLAILQRLDLIFEFFNLLEENFFALFGWSGEELVVKSVRLGHAALQVGAAYARHVVVVSSPSWASLTSKGKLRVRRVAKEDVDTHIHVFAPARVHRR